MNGHAILMVNDHIQVLLDEAAARRTVQVDKPSLRTRIASAAASVKASIDTPADYSNSILPRLDNYPYRS